MSTPLVALIEWLFHVFIALLNLTLDSICFAMLVCACAQPWRLPKVILGAMRNSDWFDTRRHFRKTCCMQCLFGICDAVTGVLYVFALLSGLRTLNLLHKTCRLEEDSARYRRTLFAGRWALATWSQAGGALLDVLPFLFLLLCFAMPWRWLPLARGLRKHGGAWLFQTLCPYCVSTSKLSGSPRRRWLEQAWIGVVEGITYVPLVLVLLTRLRARKLCSKLKQRAGKHDEMRQCNFEQYAAVWVQFGSLLVDLAFVPIALVVLLSGWRTSALLGVLADKERKGMRKRGAAIWQSVELFIDVPFIMMGGFVVLLAPWRWWTLWHELRLGRPASFGEGAAATEARRRLAFSQLRATLVDYAAILCGACVLLTPWRSRSLLATLNLTRRAPPADVGGGQGAPPAHSIKACTNGKERHAATFEAFRELMLDLPCILMGAVVVATVWRAGLLLRALDLRNAAVSADSRRKSAAGHFLKLLRDVPFFLLFFVLAGTLYRLPNVLLKLVATQKRLLSSAPLLRLEEARVQSDEAGRVRLTLRGVKPPELSAEQVRLGVGGGDFWPSLEAAFGSVANVGRSLLPAKLVPKYMSAGCVCAGQAECTLTITSPPGAFKQLRKLADSSDPPFTLQGQVGAPRAVLFELHTRPSHLVCGGEEGSMLGTNLQPPQPDPDLPIQEVFYGIVALEAAQLALDLLSLLAIVALVAAPWRFVQLLKHMLERWCRVLRVVSTHGDRQACLHSLELLLGMPLLVVEERVDGIHLSQGPPLHRQWRGPTGACRYGRLYIALASVLRAQPKLRLAKRLHKLDEPLAAQWETLWKLTMWRRHFAVLEAETQRGVLSPHHWRELLWVLSTCRKVVKRVTSAQVGAPASSATPVEEPPAALAVLRIIEALKASFESTAAKTKQEISAARGQRQVGLTGLKISPVALCKRSASKARQQVAEACKEAVKDWVAFLGALVLLLSHRGPRLVWLLRGASCGRSFHGRVNSQVRELLLDAVMGLEMLVLTVTIYTAIESWLELSTLLVSKQDVEAARQMGHRRVKELLEDIGELLGTLLNVFVLWNTYRFVLATVLFAILVPVHLIGQLIVRVVNRGAKRRAVAPTTCSLWAGGAVWASLLALSIIIVYGIAPASMGTNGLIGDHYELVPVSLGVFLTLLLLIGLASAWENLSNASVIRIPYPRRALRPTSANLFAGLSMILDLCQLIAFPFLALQASGRLDRYSAAFVSNGVFDALGSFAGAVLLLSEEVETKTFQGLFWASFGLVCFWYLLFSLPVVLDHLLKWESWHGEVGESKLWQLMVVHLTTTFHLTLVMQLIKPLGCSYTPGQPSSLYADDSVLCWTSGGPLQAEDAYNNSVVNSALDADETVSGIHGSVDPWNPQPVMAACSLLALSFYLLTVHLSSSTADEKSALSLSQEAVALDIRYAELYVTVCSHLKLFAAVSYLLLREQPWALLACLVVVNSALLLWTLVYERIFGAPACCISLITRTRIAGFGIALWATVTCLFQLSAATEVSPGSGDDSLDVPWQNREVWGPARVNELLCLLGMACIPLSVASWTIIERFSSTMATGEARAKQRAVLASIQEIEDYWNHSDGVLAASWSRVRIKWRRIGRSADIPRLVEAILALEQHIRPGLQTIEFMRERPSWRKNVATATDVDILAYLVQQMAQGVVILGQVVACEFPNDEADELMANWLDLSPSDVSFLAMPRRKPCAGEKLHFLYGDLCNDLYYLHKLSVGCATHNSDPQGGNEGMVFSSTAATSLTIDSTKPPAPGRSPSQVQTVHEVAARTVPDQTKIGMVAGVVDALVLDAEKAARKHSSMTESTAQSQLALSPVGSVPSQREAPAPSADCTGGVNASSQDIAITICEQASERKARKAAGGDAGRSSLSTTNNFAQQLLRKLSEELTDLEKEDVITDAIQSKTSRSKALTCEELGQISATFMFNASRRTALVALYPFLNDKGGFVDLLEGPNGVHPYSARQDILRDLKL
ncbi:hypothetical protein AB1Y20_005991 [Prymnesium parvum]|uniref:Uncharacterized protein n=1 Tax=Prymnesium parvum TaxID=97485 RepID=A0AB34J3L2_PRYPA